MEPSTMKMILKLIVINRGPLLDVEVPSSDSVSENSKSPSLFSSNVIEAFTTVCPAYS